MMSRSLALALALLTLAQTAGAQAPAQPINVRNAGAFTCAQFLPVIRQEQRQLEKTAFLQWTAAYATAVARSNSLIDVFPIGDTWELLVMISFVCAENEAVTFETALITTLGRLRPYWIRTNPAVLTLTDPGGRTVQFYAEATTPLQNALNRLGATVTVDGAYGNETATAIQRINAQRGAQTWLTPDGEFLYQITRP